MKNRQLYIIFLLISSFVLLSAKIGEIEIYALDEVKNATCAIEMLQSGNLIVPTFNGNLRADKPPLHYYFMIAAYKIFGIHEFAARFFSVIMGMLTLLITFWASQRHLGFNAAVYISLVMLSAVIFTFQFHLAVPDPYLVFFMTLALFCFYEHYKRPRVWVLILFYVSLGLGALAKGPVAIALPGLALLLFLIFTRNLRWSVIAGFRPFSGALLVLAVALPWYVSVHYQTDGRWTEMFFLEHNISRFTNEMEGHGGIFLITFAYVLAGMLPFALFIIQGFRQAFLDRKNHFLLFALIASTTIIGFFAVSTTKLPNYTAPSYPFVSIIIGYFLSQYQTNRYGWKWSLGLFVFLGLAFPAGIYFGLSFEPSLEQYQPLSFYFLVLPAFAAAALFSYIKKFYRAVIISIAGGFMVVNFLVFFIFLPAVDDSNPVKKSMPYLPENAQVVGFRLFNPAYVFYLQRQIPKYSHLDSLQSLPHQEDIYIISRERYMPQLDSLNHLEVIFRGKDLFEKPTTIIARWKKEDG